MTDRKWDLWLIAVHADRQGQGIGGELLRYAERRARVAGARLLLIETRSLPKFDPTHAFYGRHGYREVARIPDDYADGDSKVVFTKRGDATTIASCVGRRSRARAWRVCRRRRMERL